MFASFSASIWAWARTNLFFFGDLLGRCIVFARSVYPCSHCSPCPVVSCLPAVPFAMACYLWLLLVAVFVSPVLSMYPSRSRKHMAGVTVVAMVVGKEVKTVVACMAAWTN